jgi:uncharacterized protein GlcG (DUF336 family)
MKIMSIVLVMMSTYCFGQQKSMLKTSAIVVSPYISSSYHLTLTAAIELASRATQRAELLDKKVSIAVLDASGTIVLLMRGDGVGPHNTEAARRKAYTALSTKTPTLLLLRNAASNPDTENLNTLPELILLSGGVPIWYKGNIIGSIGVAGGGSAENDDLIAKSAILTEIGFTTSK